MFRRPSRCLSLLQSLQHIRLGRLGTAQASDRKHLVLCLSNCAEVAAATRNFDLKQSVSNRHRGRNGLLTSEFRLNHAAKLAIRLGMMRRWLVPVDINRSTV